MKNLFFNVPARRKFLKSNQTELSNILTEFERVALVNPEVSFTLLHNGTEMLNLPAMGLRQRIMGVFGKKLNQELLSLDVKTTMAHVHGFIGKPEASRKKGARQFFFVNGRYMRHPYFHKAVADAYVNLIPVGEQVSYFIYFDVDPANIDVNIHPTKTEIKFENEQALWQILSAAVKETLGRFNEVPSIDFDVDGMPDIPPLSTAPYTAAPASIKPSFDPTYNPFDVSSVLHPHILLIIRKEVRIGSLYFKAWKNRRKRKTPCFRTMRSGKPAEPDSAGEGGVQTDLYSKQGAPENSMHHFQFKGSFILTSVKSGLMIIDQQRAHIKILYDRYMSQIAGHKNASQRVLFS